MSKYRKITDDFLKEISEQYMEISERWYSRDEVPLEYEYRPVRYLERVLNVPNRTVQNWLTEARKRGFLPETPRGRVSK